MSALASQITSLTIVYSTVYSGRGSKKTSEFRVTGLCAGNSPVTGEFPAQRASNAENASIWWRHHGEVWRLLSPSSRLFLRQRVPTANKENITVSYYEPVWVKSPMTNGFPWFGPVIRKSLWRHHVARYWVGIDLYNGFLVIWCPLHQILIPHKETHAKHQYLVATQLSLLASPLAPTQHRAMVKTMSYQQQGKRNNIHRKCYNHRLLYSFQKMSQLAHDSSEIMFWYQ